MTPLSSSSAGPSLGYVLGFLGAGLGVVAGIVQWALGSEIPEWTGDKLHPVQLGIITILLSLVVAAAGICFTTVGRLWYLPGPLLLVAAALLAVPRAECGA